MQIFFNDSFQSIFLHGFTDIASKGIFASWLHFTTHNNNNNKDSEYFKRIKLPLALNNTVVNGVL